MTNDDGQMEQSVDVVGELSQQDVTSESQPSDEQQEIVSQTPEESKGVNQRIKELNQANKAKDEAIKSLSDRIEELTQSETTQPFIPQVKPGEEVTTERYQQDVTQAADSIVNLRMKQFKAEERIKSDTVEAVKTYDQLNPNSDQFDPELSETITEAVEAHIRVNPYNANVKKFVDRLMKPYQKAFEKQVGEVTQQVAKQVTQTALRPTQVKQTEKSAKDLSIKELEAKLGVLQS